MERSLIPTQVVKIGENDFDQQRRRRGSCSPETSSDECSML